MSEKQAPTQSQPFDIGDLVRLNEELRQLRESLRRKRAERDRAKRAGRRLQVDLTPEIDRLSRFLVELDRVSAKLKDTPFGRAPYHPTMVETVPLDDALRKAKAEIESEKAKLETERSAREQEKLRHQLELKHLRDEFQRERQLLRTDQKLVQTVVSKKIQQSEKLTPETDRTKLISQTPRGLQVNFSTTSTAAEGPLVTTPIETINAIKDVEHSTKMKPLEESVQEEEFGKSPEAQIETEIRHESHEQTRTDEEIRREIQAKVRDEFTAIRSELQNLREQLSKEQDIVGSRREALEFERRRVEEERKILETRIADSLTTSRSELEHMRDQVSHKQQELETRQRALYEEKAKLDEERRELRERGGKIEKEHLKFMTRKIIEQLGKERIELAALKRSLEQLRAESIRDRRRLEKDRESIARARIALGNEKRKIAWKHALLEIQTRQALRRQRALRKADKAGTSVSRTEEKKEVVGRITAASTVATDGNIVVLGVRLGEENYCIDIGLVREIVKHQLITPVPRQPAYVEGVMNIRGVIIPVINLRKRFKIKGEPSADPPTVIVDSADGVVGILVDSVSEVIRLPPKEIRPALALASGLEGEYLRGICRLGEQFLLYLDLKKLLRRATPVSTLQVHLLPRRVAVKPKLNQDEQRLLKAIPLRGMSKSHLKKRTKFGDMRLQTNIRSLARKGLVTTFMDGNRQVIARMRRRTLTRQLR